MSVPAEKGFHRNIDPVLNTFDFKSIQMPLY